MKIFAISKDKNYYSIGETFDDKKWYEVGSDVKSIEVNKGDEVDIKFNEENNKRILTTITVTKKSAQLSFTSSGNGSSSNFRAPDDIQKSEIGHMVAKTLLALAGTFDQNNVMTLIDDLFAKYSSKVRG